MGSTSPTGRAGGATTGGPVRTFGAATGAALRNTALLLPDEGGGGTSGSSGDSSVPAARSESCLS